MSARLVGIGMIVLLLGGVSYAHSQKAAERHIPLGQSPGFSRIYTDIGEIESVDAERRSFTIAVTGGSRTVALTDRTRIWLDRSKLRQSTLTGSPGNLEPGQTAEVKYEDHERRERADWIKVEVAPRRGTDQPAAQ